MFGESIILAQSAHRPTMPNLWLQQDSDISHSWCEGNVCYLSMTHILWRLKRGSYPHHNCQHPGPSHHPFSPRLLGMPRSPCSQPFSPNPLQSILHNTAKGIFRKCKSCMLTPMLKKPWMLWLLRLSHSAPATLVPDNASAPRPLWLPPVPTAQNTLSPALSSLHKPSQVVPPQRNHFSSLPSNLRPWYYYSLPPLSLLSSTALIKIHNYLIYPFAYLFIMCLPN